LIVTGLRQEPASDEGTLKLKLRVPVAVPVIIVAVKVTVSPSATPFPAGVRGPLGLPVETADSAMVPTAVVVYWTSVPVPTRKSVAVVGLKVAVTVLIPIVLKKAPGLQLAVSWQDPLVTDPGAVVQIAPPELNVTVPARGAAVEHVPPWRMLTTAVSVATALPTAFGLVELVTATAVAAAPTACCKSTIELESRYAALSPDE
jgi:hypothetical protein